MLCLMHQGTPYGHLRLRDSHGGYFRPDVPALAKMAGNSPEEVRVWLAELDHVGVLSRTRSGAIFSKKMVRDERVRKQWRTRQASSRSKIKKASKDQTLPCCDDAEILHADAGNQHKTNKHKEMNACDVTGVVTPMSRGSPSSSPTIKKEKTQGGRRKAPAVKNPYPFTIYWNTKEQRLRVEDPGVIVEHFMEWAKQNGKGSVPIRELLREKQPSFERHAIEKGYTNVSPDKLTVLFCRWIESDILKYRGNRSQKVEDAFDEAIRKAEEEECE